ncbi:hypothetical protein D9611_004851 [Ephemerocybe angulata]|uniref:Ubiquitin thioesterase OTU n=1 Tax=Ephemerocybe angulata TaxID=980116 RepID=A0A8H5B2Q9_9AGAR|nr:hypothetical protein D9611_004851 [Tulosesus angulatus]
MAPIRLRHPKGVSTIQIPLDSDSYTVQDLLQEIYKATEILPSHQNLKTGYPPRSLTLVPELPLGSLDLKSGEQLIVQEVAPTSSRGTDSAAAAAASRSPPRPTASRPAQAPVASRPASAAPAPAPRTPAPEKSGKPESVEVDGGYLIHRVVPDDNSCLFSSLSLLFEQSITKAPELRKIVAEGIKKDPETYNEAILGMPPSKYIETISKPISWGGAIELGILASHYNTEIASVDVETGRIDKFAPGPEGAGGEGNRVIIVYSGIHYDAVSFSPMEDAPDEWHQKVFPIKAGKDENDSILVAVKKLADALRSKKAFTNTATFDLRCEDCGQGLKGEKGARAHAEATGHVRFGEY